jgi:hypothetical protein
MRDHAIDLRPLGEDAFERTDHCRQRRFGAIARTVRDVIEREHRQSLRTQRFDERFHLLRPAAPAMHQQHRRLPTLAPAVGRDHAIGNDHRFGRWARRAELHAGYRRPLSAKEAFRDRARGAIGRDDGADPHRRANRREL